MISWRVEVQVSKGEKYPKGWDTQADDCFFPDYDHQEFLLPFFDVGDEIIDECGLTVFHVSDLQRLEKRLASYLKIFAATSEEWSVRSTMWGKSSQIHIQRSVVLELIEKTLNMARYAISINGTMEFFGD